MSTVEPIVAATPSAVAPSVPSSQTPSDALAPSTGAGAPPLRRRRSPTPKAPKDSKVYKTVMAIVALKAQGQQHKAIAETLGLSEHTIGVYLQRAVQKGWLNAHSFQTIDDHLDFIVRDKVARNVTEFLDERDKEVTIEAAKGLGMFKTHQVVKGGEGAAVGFALRVQVELPPGAAAQSVIAVRPGTIGGERAKEIPIEAEIVGNGEDNA